MTAEAEEPRASDPAEYHKEAQQLARADAREEAKAERAGAALNDGKFVRVGQLEASRLTDEAARQDEERKLLKENG